MQANEIVEFAALLAGNAEAFIFADHQAEAGAIDQYWALSKCRLERWGRAMKAYSAAIDQPAASRRQLWSSVRATLDEILVSEMLTRIWTAVAVAYDARHNQNELRPIVRSVYTGHLDARNRALNLMVCGKGFDVVEAVNINRLRRLTERWTDLLLARLPRLESTAEFAFDNDRVVEFARDLGDHGSQFGNTDAWRLMLTSLTAAFAQISRSDAGNGDLNRQISATILSCYGPQLFDSTGGLHSICMLRIAAAASDTQLLVDELLALDSGPTVDRQWRELRRRGDMDQLS